LAELRAEVTRVDEGVAWHARRVEQIERQLVEAAEFKPPCEHEPGAPRALLVI